MSDSKLVLVGEAVYREKELVAAWIKGAWYRFEDGGSVGKKAWVHIDPLMCKRDLDLVSECNALVREGRAKTGGK